MTTDRHAEQKKYFAILAGEQPKPAKITVTLPLEIPLDRICDLLCSAFEGGSNYWYDIVSQRKPRTFSFRTDENHIYPHLDYPLNPGGSLTIGDIEGRDLEKRTLNLKKIRKGLKIFAEKCPRHFGNFLSENDDAETGDVFLQCCLFGEIVYG